MKIRYVVAAIVSFAMVSQSGADESFWQWSKLPGEATGRSIPDIERKLADLYSFNTLLDNWKQQVNLGVTACSPDIKKLNILDEFPAGTQKVFPKAGQTLAYSTSSARSHPSRPDDQHVTAKSTTITVVDADTKEVVAEHELELRFHGGIHDSILTPDGRYIIAAGPLLSDYMAMKSGDEETAARIRSLSEVSTGKTGDTGMTADFYSMGASIGKSLSTILKIDALTLEPVQLIKFVGNPHHGGAMGRNFSKPNMMWMDTFEPDAENGAAFAIFNPDTLEVHCAGLASTLGKSQYIAHFMPLATGEKFIMTTAPYEPYVGAQSVGTGDPMYLPPNYLLVIDPETGIWEREIPTPPMTGGITIADQKMQYIYNNSAGTDTAYKQDFKTGRLVWKMRTGLGPYGMTFNKDHSEIWVADKGESVDYWGRTLTVIDDFSGRIKARIGLPGFGVDHVVLAPNGKEIWATSNAWGQIYVIDAESKEITKTLDMYGRGSTHGAVFVYFGDDLKPQVMQDSHEFIERTPALDKPFRTYYVVDREPSGTAAAMKEINPMAKGRALFQALDGCSACHGLNGQGMIGPDIRGKGIDAVLGALQTKKDMKAWQGARKMTDQEIHMVSMWLSER
ncbi:MAG: c-type cytochrome [Halioglobus sp.]